MKEREGGIGPPRYTPCHPMFCINTSIERRGGGLASVSGPQHRTLFEWFYGSIGLSDIKEHMTAGQCETSYLNIKVTALSSSCEWTLGCSLCVYLTNVHSVCTVLFRVSWCLAIVFLWILWKEHSSVGWLEGGNSSHWAQPFLNSLETW